MRHTAIGTALLSVSFVLLVLSALNMPVGLAADPEAPKAVSRRLVVHLSNEPASLDWNVTNPRIDQLILQNLHEGLVSVGEDLKIQPVLAERWEISPDGRKYTFFLRSDVYWSDGVKLTAQHFVDGWRRLLSPATASPNRSYLFEVQGAEDFSAGRLKDFEQVGLRAESPTRLTVEYRRSAWSGLWAFAHPSTYPIRADLIRKYGEKFWTSPGSLVTLGAFVLKGHDQGARYLLARNPKYYGKTGNLDELEFRILSDDDALRQFKQGSLDVICSAKRGAVAAAVVDKSRVHWFEPFRTKRLDFNLKKFPMNNRLFRKAVAQAIDRARLARDLGQGARPAFTAAPPTLASFSPKGGVIFDPKGAREQLKRAFVEPANVSLELMVPLFDENAEENLAVANFLKKSLEDNLRIKVSTRGYDTALSYYMMRDTHQYSILLRDWNVDVPNVTDFYSFYEKKTGKSSTWSNDDYDRAVERARNERDPARSVQVLTEAERILVETDVGMVPLFYGSEAALVGSRVIGFHNGAFGICRGAELSVP